MKYTRAHDMDSWRSDPRIAARGFAHRWHSSVAAGNGEDAFIELVEQYLRPERDVLDVGCGHGEFTLTLAARCRTITGIEREPGYLDLAKELAAEQKITNVQFYQVDLNGAAEQAQDFAGIPLPDASIDLFINRRGPILRRYLEEARRVARRGAVMVGLHPTGIAPAPSWRDELPAPYLQACTAFSYDEVTGWVIKPLQAAGITEYSLWWIDVPEFLPTAYELYRRLGGTQLPDVPEYQEIEPQLTQIIERHRTPQGLILRHQRLLWQVCLPT